MSAPAIERHPALLFQLWQPGIRVVVGRGATREMFDLG